MLDKKWRVEDLPDEFVAPIGKSKWKQITVGESGAYTFLLTNEHMPNRYLKISPLDLKMNMKREAELLIWLKGKLPVPEVLLFNQDNDNEFLLMSEISGLLSFDPVFVDDLPQLVRLLAKGLRLVHSVDISNCPFDETLDVKLKKAEYRVINGLVDETDIDGSRLGRTAVDLYQKLIANRPLNEDAVFTHGDFCLPNIIINNGDISGFIDWSRGGIADRYQDLALAARNLAYNYDAKWVPLLFQEYGIDDMDYEKIEYYKLLDEFF